MTSRKTPTRPQAATRRAEIVREYGPFAGVVCLAVHRLLLAARLGYGAMGVNLPGWERGGE